MARPRVHDREAIAQAFEKYISETELPIIAEFAYLNDVPRETLYQWDELKTLIKRCIDKKEAALERGMIGQTYNVTAAIFSLKQLGWKDKIEHSGDKDAPIALNLKGSDIHG